LDIACTELVRCCSANPQSTDGVQVIRSLTNMQRSRVHQGWEALTARVRLSYLTAPHTGKARAVF